MSRTYRRHLVSEYKVSGRIYNEENSVVLDELYKPEWGIWYFSGHGKELESLEMGSLGINPVKSLKKLIEG